jgi:hypothetical protein
VKPDDNTGGQEFRRTEAIWFSDLFSPDLLISCFVGEQLQTAKRVAVAMSAAWSGCAH